MANRESKPTAAPLPQVTEYVVKRGSQGVFSSSSKAAAARHLSDLEVSAASSGGEQNLSLWERVVTYAPLAEDHPQFDSKDPAKVPTGEASIGHPGTVKERKIS